MKISRKLAALLSTAALLTNTLTANIALADTETVTQAMTGGSLTLQHLLQIQRLPVRMSLLQLQQ